MQNGTAVLSYSGSSLSWQHSVLCGASLCAAFLGLAKPSLFLFSLLNPVSGTEAWKLGEGQRNDMSPWVILSVLHSLTCLIIFFKLLPT